MDIDVNALEVVHNREQKRFEIQIGDQVAMIEYMLAGNNIIYHHTEVPPAFEGKGIGNKLAQHVMDYAVANGHKVQALCPFVAAYVKRHKEYQPITWGYF